MNYMKRQKLHDELDKVIAEASMRKNCGNCIYGIIDENRCAKFDAAPPMKIVLAGCDNYIELADDDIPF